MHASTETNQASSEQEVLKAARSKFASMAGSYFMGTFNDNFYKQAVMLLAVAAGLNKFQGMAAAAFTIPFILFAAPAGWVADRFPKRHVVVGAKVTELLAALVGAAGIISGHLWLMVGMVGLMGLQSTFFSPALNGSIPELYPESHVTRANAVLRMIVTVGILLGISLSGFVLGVQGAPILGAPRGKALVGLLVILFAAIGLVTSFGIPTRPAADPTREFPRRGPLDTLEEIGRIWKDRQLGRILVADVFIWAVGVFQLLIINTLGLKQFHLSEGQTSLLVAAQLLGLGGGGLLAATLAKGNRWFRVLVPACLGMALFMGCIWAVPFLPLHAQIPSLYAFIALAGASGGLFLIPCESFLQIRPAPERKGAVWASANFASFSGMALASVLYMPLAGLRPTLAYGVLGAGSLVFAFWLIYEFRNKEWA